MNKHITKTKNVNSTSSHSSIMNTVNKMFIGIGRHFNAKQQEERRVIKLENINAYKSEHSNKDNTVIKRRKANKVSKASRKINR